MSLQAPATTLPAPTPQTGIERRVFDRHACELSATVQPTSGWGQKESRWPATIRDLSLGGLCCLLGRRYEPGTSLAIELPGGYDRSAYTVIVKVMRVSRRDGGWSLGCKFAGELTEDEVRSLLPFVEAVNARKKAQEGQTLTDVRFQLTDAGRTVLNCQIRRLYVPGTWPFTPGKTLKMFGDTANGFLPEFRVRLVECSRQGEGWALHGQLLRSK